MLIVGDDKGGGDLNQGIVNNGAALTLDDRRTAVQSVFTGTTCYDLIPNSAKAIVFETTIPFQMAFYALIEHDTSVAPLWDPRSNSFAGLMTIADYINALKLCRRENVSMFDLSSRTIADLMESAMFEFQNAEFSSIDAEDSVHMMCYHLNSQESNFVPIINPDNGSLVAILGYIDLIHLIDQAAKQHAHLFSTTLQEMGFDVNKNSRTALESTSLLSILEDINDFQCGYPILDATGVVIGIYHKTDITFITKAAEPDAVLANLENYSVGDVLKLQQAGELGPLTPPLVTCCMTDRIDSIISVMMQARSPIVVIVDDASKFVGALTIAEIIKFYLE